MKPYKVSSKRNPIVNRQQEFYDASRAHYYNWIQANQAAPVIPDYDFTKLSPPEVVAFHNNQTLQNASQWGLIVFSAFTLEAFINFYAEIHKIPGRREKERTLGTKKKFRSYPNLVAGKNIDDEAIACVKSIFRQRDLLVHYKPIKGEYEHPVFCVPHHGRAMLNKLHCAVRALDELKAPLHSSIWIGDDFENALDWEVAVES